MEDKIDEIDWENIIVRLHAYTASITKSVKWYRGTGTSSFVSGKQIEDYVYEAVARYLENPELHKPEKGTLIKFLKYYIIRSLVSNDLVSAENRTSNAMQFTVADGSDDDYEDRYYELAEAFFDEDIDYSDITAVIREQIGNDPAAESVYIGTVEEGLKRRDIMEMYSLSAAEYGNGIRRLKTILKRIAEKFEIKSKS